MEIYEIVYHSHPGLFLGQVNGKLFKDKEAAESYCSVKNKGLQEWYESQYPEFCATHPYSIPYYTHRTLKVEE